MKSITHTKRARDKTLHVETDLGIVNIYVNLHDVESNMVESVEISPDNGVSIDVGNGVLVDYLRVRLVKKP